MAVAQSAAATAMAIGLQIVFSVFCGREERKSWENVRVYTKSPKWF